MGDEFKIRNLKLFGVESKEFSYKESFHKIHPVVLSIQNIGEDPSSIHSSISNGPNYDDTYYTAHYREFKRILFSNRCTYDSIIETISNFVNYDVVNLTKPEHRVIEGAFTNEVYFDIDEYVDMVKQRIYLEAKRRGYSIDRTDISDWDLTDVMKV